MGIFSYPCRVKGVGCRVGNLSVLVALVALVKSKRHHPGASAERVAQMRSGPPPCTDFGLRVSGFGCRVSGFNFRVSGIGLGVWGLGFRV